MWNWHDLGVAVPQVRLQILRFQVVDRTGHHFDKLQQASVAFLQLETMKAIELWQKREKFEPSNLEWAKLQRL